MGRAAGRISGQYGASYSKKPRLIRIKGRFGRNG